ncbi:MAG: hypothetical protein V3V63_04695 [Candidatus Hydrothermarchaeaceae archaeon]
MPKEITFQVSGEVYDQLEEIREDGDYESVAFVVRKAIIEWLKEREIRRRGVPEVKYIKKND